MMPPTMMPMKAGVLKSPKVELDVDDFVGDVLEPVGVGFEPAVGVTTPAPVLTAPPDTAGVVANPPKGVTEVPPYWLTIVAKSDTATDTSAVSQNGNPEVGITPVRPCAQQK